MASSFIDDTINSIEWKMLGVALLVIPHLSAILTQYLTRYGRKEFYTCVKRPLWTPPFWIATIAWAMSYTFIGISSYLIWVDSDGFQGAAQAVAYLYICLIVLSCSWQILLYNIQSPALAALNLAILTGLSGYCANQFMHINKMAYYLVLPCAAWLFYVTIIHIMIWSMNRVLIKLE